MRNLRFNSTLFLFYILGMPLMGISQTVSGKVSDSISAVAGARVTLFNADTSFFREARTDAAGFFRVENVPTGSYRLGASYPKREYKEVTITVSASGAQFDFTLGPETHSGEWKIIGDAGEPFGGTNSGVLLPDGRIIYCHDTQDPIIFDPATNKIVKPPPSPKIQGCHATCLLPDGRVIYVGGADQQVYGPGTRQVKTFDPKNSTWQIQPDLNDDRWYPSMVQLPEGELLAVGGGGLNNPVRINTSEILNPSTMTWTPVGNIQIGNEVSPIVLLYTGEVLMTHRPPQLYNPTTKQWRRAADFVQGNRMPNGDHSDHEIILMPDGKVVAIGFKSFVHGNFGNMVEIYDPAGNTWKLGANFSPVRSRASLALLPNKKILATGGYKEKTSDPTPTNQWGYMNLTDQYDPQTNSWRRLANMNLAREYHAMPILVPDGRVIILGGEGQPGIEPDKSTLEAFRPPYLFRGVRPVIKNLAQTTIARGGSISFIVDRTSAPSRLILMGTSATTHFMDSGIARYLELGFIQRGQQITAQIPSDPVRTPLGFYILLALVDDIPSVGRIIKIAPTPSTGVHASPENLPAQPALYQNYPNPFNPTTSIEFYLPQSAFVTLKVFNVAGEEMVTVLAEKRNAGRHQVEWNAEQIANGVYWYRFQAEGFIQTRKLLLLK